MTTPPILKGKPPPQRPALRNSDQSSRVGCMSPDIFTIKFHLGRHWPPGSTPPGHICADECKSVKLVPLTAYKQLEQERDKLREAGEGLAGRLDVALRLLDFTRSGLDSEALSTWRAVAGGEK